MDAENSIIPLCLYSNNINSQISLPEKISKNGSIIYSCPSRKNMDLVMVFYAINPDVKPNPTYADLIGVKNTNQETVEITNIYDPFNKDENISIRFLAWLETTPNTTPLYITTNGTNLYISPYPNDYSPYKIPIIHVLTNPASNLPKTPHSFGSFSVDGNGMPIFKFSDSYGKCVPDPQGKLTLGECVVMYNKNITRPQYIGKSPNILTYLQVTYGSRKKSAKIVDIISIVFAVILVVCIIVLFWLKMKKYESQII